MDLVAVTYRNHPYIDGVTYPRMCFGCAHVPKDRIQKYDEQGNVAEEIGPLFSYKHLYTPEELVHQGTCGSLAEAKRCVRAVKIRLKEVGKRTLDKLKLRRPEQEYVLTDEPTEKNKKSARKPREKAESPPRAAPKKRVKRGRPKLTAKKVRRSET